MSKFIRIFFTGMVISFLGSLPLGTLNVAVMQISISDGLVPAFKFALAALLVEIIYVRLSLVAMDWVRKQEKLIRIFEWVTLGIIIALAASSFYAALQPHTSKNIILSSTLDRFLLGLIMSAINPVQIPFWFGWSTVLFTKKVLLPKISHYNTYIAGIALGTFIASCVFIFGGRFIAVTLNANQDNLNWVIGGIFALTAIIQAVKMARKKDPAHQLEHPEEVTHGLEDQIAPGDENSS